LWRSGSDLVGDRGVVAEVRGDRIGGRRRHQRREHAQRDWLQRPAQAPRAPLRGYRRAAFDAYLLALVLQRGRALRARAQGRLVCLGGLRHGESV
jgi:hypothetical protein